MSSISKAQKVRLGLFMLSALTLLGITLVYMIGITLLEDRDPYLIVFNESISGLEPGSPVKYNGVRVGSVEGFSIPADNVTGVQVDISLEKGTPVKEDTVAVLNLQGITGLKFIDLTAGTNRSKRLSPGNEITSMGSTMDLLQSKATSIAQKIESLLDNLVAVTGGEEGDKLPKLMDEVQRLIENANRIVETNEPDLRALAQTLANASAHLEAVLQKGPGTLETAEDTMRHLTQLITKEQMGSLLDRVVGLAAAAEARLSKKEMGAAISSFTELTNTSEKFVARADVTLMRARDDVLRALDELLTGVEHFSEFASILRDNPSALIGGGQKQERILP